MRKSWGAKLELSRSKIDYNDIDVGMREIIRVLNDKGYETVACCEGHWKEKYNRYVGMYIYFKEPILFPIIEGYKNDKKNTKNGHYYTRKNKKCHYWVEPRYKRMSKEEKDIEHEKLLNEILKTVKGFKDRI